MKHSLGNNSAKKLLSYLNDFSSLLITSGSFDIMSDVMPISPS